MHNWNIMNREEKKNEAEERFEVIMDEYFPELMAGNK